MKRKEVKEIVRNVIRCKCYAKAAFVALIFKI